MSPKIIKKYFLFIKVSWTNIWLAFRFFLKIMINRPCNFYYKFIAISRNYPRFSFIDFHMFIISDFRDKKSPEPFVWRYRRMIQDESRAIVRKAERWSGEGTQTEVKNSRNSVLPNRPSICLLFWSVQKHTSSPDTLSSIGHLVIPLWCNWPQYDWSWRHSTTRSMSCGRSTTMCPVLSSSV